MVSISFWLSVNIMRGMSNAEQDQVLVAIIIRMGMFIMAIG